ncbi:MAG: TrkH family potassium uptake protein [Clostridia bacterium]|nr:TrkH family potassium uptake protein [Clostridia bacterium]
MNYKTIFGIIGKVLIIEAVFLLIPMGLSLLYQDSKYLSFLIPASILFAVGLPLSFLLNKNTNIRVKESFVIVVLSWVLFSVFGALPFVISKEIPNYIDALFETVSGFSTTGASILEDVEVLSKSIAFWRIFTHFIGGMGVLVFLLAIFPKSSLGSMYLFKAESPGPTASKIVGKISYTSRILYAIYLGLTALLIILLSFSKIGIYDSVLTAFSTAGTGGFALHNGSIAYYDSRYVEIVITIFMFLFGVNFNVFFLIISGHALKGLKSEEFLVYLSMVIVSAFAIAINILSTVSNFGEALRISFFQVTAISSSTGFSTANINAFPALSKSIIFVLMIIGASAGSTGGGLKVVRASVLLKSGFSDLRKNASNREIVNFKFEGKPVTSEVSSNIRTFFIFYVVIVIVSTILLSFDSFADGDLLTHFTASITCISNVGPSFSATINPLNSFAGYSGFSKIVLSVVMLAGRLEIFPLILFFQPRTWKKG